MRNIRTNAGVGHDHGDGADGTRLGAETMSDALVGVYDHGFAAEHGQDVALGTDGGASGATDAIVGINLRMLRVRPARA